ncbi:class I tRNA ligase family protein [Vibrio lentus]|nr:class I tRNA ligase family protein [Vibrio lentus]
MVLLWLKLKLNTKIKFLHLSMWKFSAADKEAALLEKFTLAEGHAGQGEISIVIWTTTPWTLPANR